MPRKNKNKEYAEVLDKLKPMRLPGMRGELEALINSGEIATISNLELIQRIVDSERESRREANIRRLKKQAHIEQPTATLEDLKDPEGRGLPIAKIQQISTNTYIDFCRNIVCLGACGCGKSYLLSAFANKACEDEYHVLYFNFYEFLQYLNSNLDVNGFLSAEARKKIKNLDLVVIDDFLICGNVSKDEVNLIFQFMECCALHTSVMIGSQLSVEEWHTCLGKGIQADAILDRIVSPAFILTLAGDSMRLLEGEEEIK